MTAWSPIPTPADGTLRIAAADLARYGAAAAAADDPELCFGPSLDSFSDMRRLLLAGERRAADGAGLVVQDCCLALCASEAASARASGHKRSFLETMIGWAWPRVPAVAAVLEASRAAELARWGPPTRGSG